MILSINFSGKSLVIFILLLIMFAGCSATKESTVSLLVRSPDVKEPVVSLHVRNHDVNERQYRVAVLPVNNLSGTIAPLKEIRQSLINTLRIQGLNVLDEEVLETFMSRHRLRYTGGIDRITAEAFREQTGVKAVLITSLELYDDNPPLKIALTSRLISAEFEPEILWLDSLGLAGNDSPGILGLGLIEYPLKLREKALQIFSKSLTGHLSGRNDKIYTGGKSRKKFMPKLRYHSPVINPETRYTIAVIPFLNISTRTYAGEIMGLHFVKQLREHGNLSVIEPGAVRGTLLGTRIIMNDGISLADADIIFSRLNADLILTGTVMDYQDYQGSIGTPKVDFSVTVIDKKSREVVLTSKSYNTGDDGVFLFDFGRVNTAHALASEMTKGVVELLME